MLTPTSAVDPPYSRGEAGYTTLPSYHFYKSNVTGPALTTAFQLFEFNDTRPLPDGSTAGKFLSTGIILADDSNANWIEFSFDGTQVDGRVLWGDTLNFGMKRERRIWLRGQAGAEAYRLWAW